jgi:hypothetical protein
LFIFVACIALCVQAIQAKRPARVAITIACPGFPPFEVKHVSRPPETDKLVVVSFDDTIYLLPAECEPTVEVSHD